MHPSLGLFFPDTGWRPEIAGRPTRSHCFGADGISPLPLLDSCTLAQASAHAVELVLG